MSESLRDRYNRKALDEARQFELILEKLDPEKIQKISAAIDALEKVIPDNLEQFRGALEKAKAELSKSYAGGIKTGITQAITRPLSRAMALADGLKTGFKQIPQLLKTFADKAKQNDANLTLAQMVDDAKKQQFINAVKNAIRPTGPLSALGKLFTGGGIPFLDNPDLAIEELMNLKVADVTRLTTSANATPPVATPDVEAEVVSNQQQTPTQQPATQPTQPTTATQPTSPTATTTPTQSTTPAQGAITQKAIDDYKKNIVPRLTPAQKQDIIATLQASLKA